MGGKLKLFAIVILLILKSNAFGNMPGGGTEKAEPRCIIMGQVTKSDLNAMQAWVTLKKTFGSTTQMGCLETNAEKMIGQTISVSLNLIPRPRLNINDIVFVNKGLNPKFALEGPSSETIESLSESIQVQWNNELQLAETSYFVKAYFGSEKSIQKLVQVINTPENNSMKEKRVSAAVFLIALAVNHHEVPQAQLRKAFLIALEQSYKGVEIGTNILLIKDGRTDLISELVSLLNKTETNLKFPAVKDPYGIIVALGEIGPQSKTTIPVILKRMDGVSESIRSHGDELILTAITKIGAQQEAAQQFLDMIKSGNLKSKDGVLAHAICKLGTYSLSKTFTQLVQWCKSR
ncbi:MAG: hypothetical protein K1X29_06180 [Bdellovibrionales bacterium]|nr:hypothetical protein [Bdellovibrionales bacterium]